MSGRGFLTPGEALAKEEVYCQGPAGTVDVGVVDVADVVDDVDDVGSGDGFVDVIDVSGVAGQDSSTSAGDWGRKNPSGHALGRNGCYIGYPQNRNSGRYKGHNESCERDVDWYQD